MSRSRHVLGRMAWLLAGYMQQGQPSMVGNEQEFGRARSREVGCGNTSGATDRAFKLKTMGVIEQTGRGGLFLGDSRASVVSCLPSAS